MIPKPKRKVDRNLLEHVRKLPCIVCGKPAPSDPSHIRTRGSGGPDLPFNVIPHCRVCHRQFEDARYAFLKKHPRFMLYLETMGWRLEGFKLRHPELEAGE